MVDVACTPMNGKGQILANLLMEQLGIPKSCTGFDVSFNAGELIKVTIRTVARESDPPGAIDVTPVTNDTRVFRLFEIDNG